MDEFCSNSPRSPRALEAKREPDRYTERYARAILGAPLAAIPVAVERLVRSEEHFPSVPRWAAEVQAVARQHFQYERRSYTPSASGDLAHHCCGSRYQFRRFRAPIVRRGEVQVDDFGEPVTHEYERNVCDCQAAKRVAAGEEEIELSPHGVGTVAS